MSLEEKINADIKQAMFAKDKAKLDALRAVKAAVLLVKTSKPQGQEITAEEEIQTLQRLVKQRKEASLTYKEQNREDLYNDEVFQLEVIEQYLPKQLSEEEIVELDEDKKAAMVSNLLVVLCADEAAQPVVNTGTLNH